MRSVPLGGPVVSQWYASATSHCIHLTVEGVAIMSIIAIFFKSNYYIQTSPLYQNINTLHLMTISTVFLLLAL